MNRDDLPLGYEQRYGKKIWRVGRPCHDRGSRQSSSQLFFWSRIMKSAPRIPRRGHGISETEKSRELLMRRVLRVRRRKSLGPGFLAIHENPGIFPNKSGVRTLLGVFDCSSSLAIEEQCGFDWRLRWHRLSAQGED